MTLMNIINTIRSTNFKSKIYWRKNLVSKNIKRILFILRGFSNLSLPRLLANKEDTRNLPLIIQSAGIQIKKKVDLILNLLKTFIKCEQALVWEKSEIRKAALFYVIAELKNVLKNLEIKKICITI